MNSQIEQLRFHITGETGGTGASTTAQEVADKLHLPKLSGGVFFRSLSYAYQEYVNTNRSENVGNAELWDTFKASYKRLFTKEGITGVLSLVTPYFTSPSNETVLKKFQSDQRDLDGGDPFWDVLTDQFMLTQAYEKPGYVWESKLAVVIHDIDQFSEIRRFLDAQRTFALPVIKILLTTDLEEAARRISQREGRETTGKDVLERQTRDWDRYGQIYSVRNRSLNIRDARKTADRIIDTTHIDLDTVTHSVLAMAVQKLSHIPQKNENEATQSARISLRKAQGK